MGSNGASLASLPPWMLVALGALVIVQLSVEVFALVDLYRLPVDRVVGGRKWLWAILIVFVNLVGAIVYLAAGRKPEAAVDAVSDVSVAERSAQAVDALYGSRDEAGPR